MSTQTTDGMKRILAAALSVVVLRGGVRSRSGHRPARQPVARRRRSCRRRRPRPRRPARPRRSGPSGSPWTGRRTPTTRASTSPQANGWYDRGRRRPPDPAVCQHDPGGPDRRRPGRVRHQLPGRADVRRGRRGAGRLGHGDPPAHGPGDRGPRVVRHRAAEGPRRPDLRRLRLPERGADAQERDRGRRRQGHVQDRHPRHRRVRGALCQARRLRDHVRGLGGHRGEAAGHRAADVQVRRLRLPRLLPGRPRLRQPLAGSRARARARVRRARRSAASSSPPTIRTAPPRCWSPRTRASSTATRRCPLASQQFLADGGYLRDESGAVGRQTLAKWQGYSGFLFDAGPARRAGRQAARHARPTTRRCSRTTSCRETDPPGPLGTAGRPGRDRRPGLGGLRPPGRHRPDHAARAVAGRSARCGTSARPRSATSSRRWSRRSSAAACPWCSPSPRPSRSIAGSRSAGRSSRCSSPARRSRSWPSRRCSSSGSGSACCPRS